MSRAIKFRVWDNTKKQMFPVRELFWRHSQEEMAGNYWFVESEEDEYGQEVWIPRTEADGFKHTGTFMQFTGLVDKNGTDIYEGDIVRKHSPNGNRTHEVIFKDGAFVIQLIETGSDPYYLDVRHDLKDMEVIGNVHETPEQGEE